MPGLKPYRTIQTGPTSDAFRDGWERAFGKKPKRNRRTPRPIHEVVAELRAAADRQHSGDNAAVLEGEADAIESAARADGSWDG